MLLLFDDGDIVDNFRAPSGRGFDDDVASAAVDADDDVIIVR